MVLSIITRITGIQTAEFRPRKFIGYNKKTGAPMYDNPQNESRSGVLSILIGTLAIIFAGRNIKRLRRERQTIQKMWDENMTLQRLKDIVVASRPRTVNQPGGTTGGSSTATTGTGNSVVSLSPETMTPSSAKLPDVCLIKGKINADGIDIVPLTCRIPPLHQLMGKIDQPPNFFISALDSIRGNSRDSSSGEKQAVKQALSSHGINFDEIPQVDDDYTVRDVQQGNGSYVISELLVTRLGCEATRKEEKDKEGNVTVKITRKPKAARFNIHHQRQESEGLYLIDAENDNEQAALELPVYDIKGGDSPELFLSLPEAMHEFRGFLSMMMPFVNLVNANKPFTHLSKFIFIDQQSATDDGNQFAKKEKSSSFWDSHVYVRERTNPVTIKCKDHVGVLDLLGRASPNDWHWNPHAFYDNNPSSSWSKWNEEETISYEEMKYRIPEAAKLNSRYQEAAEGSIDHLRDEENCFRICELGVPRNAEVTILAKPVLSDETTEGSDGMHTRSIKLIAPSKPEGIFTDRFQFRILKGHTIENLLKHRDLGMAVYAGLAIMGVFTIWFGKELIRKSIEVTYSDGSMSKNKRERMAAMGHGKNYNEWREKYK